ncbi:MAG: ParB/RepB/Spo0J family partition protein [Clostridia bacterium]|nr:ParB/RepB/Spo0J family partition protein [Clostridia bacterium]
MENIKMIDIEHIYPHPDNPRKDVGDVSELAESIKSQGIMQNLTVVPFVSKFNPGIKREGDYTVIIGHRRLAAAKKAGLREVPCAIVEMSEKEQIATMLSENMQRVDLSVSEEVQGIQMLLDLGDSVNDITKLTGFSESKVRQRMKLGKLSAEELGKCKGGTLQDFVKIAEIEDENDRKEVLRAVGTSNFNYALASASNRQTQRKTKAEWLEKLSSFATPIKVTAGKKYVTCQYFSWSPKNYNIPEDKDSINYYYEDVGNMVRIYKDYTPEEAAKNAEENAKRNKEAQEKDARMKALGEMSRQFEKLRWDFVKEYRGDKSHAYDLTKFLIDFLYDYIGYKNIEGESELREFLRLPDDEDFRESEEYSRILIRTPQKLLLTFIALQVENCKRNTWNWYGAYSEQEDLTAYYKVLRRCGYEMADAEKAFYDGSHEAYYVGEDDEE